MLVLKASYKSSFDSYSFRNSVMIISHIPYYLSELSHAHFFLRTFLKIAVYMYIVFSFVGITGTIQ